MFHFDTQGSQILNPFTMRPVVSEFREISPMLNKVFRVSVVLLIGIVSGLVGWLIGALIGGNYAEQFVFNGVRGYEATGQIGFILGALTGWFSSWRLVMKKES